MRESDGRPARGIIVSAAPTSLSPEEFLPDSDHGPVDRVMTALAATGAWTVKESGIVFANCSGADGSFEIVGLPDGPCRVGARGGRAIPGRAPDPFQVRLPDVPAGTLDLILTLPPLPPGPALTSAVVDAGTGEPLPARPNSGSRTAGCRAKDRIGPVPLRAGADRRRSRGDCRPDQRGGIPGRGAPSSGARPGGGPRSSRLPSAAGILDGRVLMKEDPRFSIRLPPGAHAVRLKGQGDRSIVRTVWVPVGGEIELDLDLP